MAIPADLAFRGGTVDGLVEAVTEVGAVEEAMAAAKLVAAATEEVVVI